MCPASSLTGERLDDSDDDDYGQDRKHDEERLRGPFVIYLTGVTTRWITVREQKSEASPNRHEPPRHDERDSGRDPCRSQQDS